MSPRDQCPPVTSDARDARLRGERRVANVAWQTSHDERPRDELLRD